MNALEHQAFADNWEARASIRTRPRRLLEDDSRLIYPLSRQPLASAASLLTHCPEQRDFVLVQSLYKFINDVVIFETEIVDRTARSIAKDRFPIRFPFACRYAAMTVVVDEDYHALVAMDFMQQAIAMTAIEPLPLPAEIELSRAIPAALALAPAHLQGAVELICVALAENTVTHDVAAFAQDPSLKPAIKGMMADHLLDEGRHAGFWTQLVRDYWQTVEAADQARIAAILAVFIEHYLTNQLQQAFDLQVIEHLPVSREIRQALADEARALVYPINRQHPLLLNILRFLRSSSLLDSPCVQQALRGYLA